LDTIKKRGFAAPKFLRGDLNTINALSPLWGLGAICFGHSKKGRFSVVTLSFGEDGERSLFSSGLSDIGLPVFL